MISIDRISAQRPADSPYTSKWFRNVRVIPTSPILLNETTRRLEYGGGLYDDTGALIEAGSHLGGGTTNVPALTSDERPTKFLKGRYFFAGWLRHHFGHFINESLGRFWAFEPGEFNGVIFILYGNADREPRRVDRRIVKFRQRRFIQEAMECLGVDLPLHLVGYALQVENLMVPRQIHLDHVRSDLAGAARIHRQTFLRIARSRHIAGVPGMGDKIYLSRSRLGAVDGKFILEDVIEANLRRSGYTIVHPECLSLPQQIAAYVNAKTMIFAEGSAIHLGAPFCSDGKRVVVVSRRFPTPRKFEAQLAASGGAGINIIGERRGHVASFLNARTPAHLLNRTGLRLSPVLLNFERLGARLAEGGFIDIEHWTVPTEHLVRERIEATVRERAEALPEMDHRYEDAPFSNSELAPLSAEVACRT